MWEEMKEKENEENYKDCAFIFSACAYHIIVREGRKKSDMDKKKVEVSTIFAYTIFLGKFKSNLKFLQIYYCKNKVWLNHIFIL